MALRHEHSRFTPFLMTLSVQGLQMSESLEYAAVTRFVDAANLLTFLLQVIPAMSEWQSF